MQQYPSYRLKGGKIVVQEHDDGRWSVVDGEIADAMLSVFDGLTLDALRNTVGKAGTIAQSTPLKRVA